MENIIKFRGLDINKQSPKGHTALIVASILGEKEYVNLLLSKGANPNIKDLTNGNTALIMVCMKKEEKGDNMDDIIIALLKGRQTDINLSNKKGETALMAATSTGRINAMNALIRKGADVNHASISGITALHLAVIRMNMAAVKLLLKSGATPRTSIYGITPLHTAIEKKHEAIVELLVKYGADLNAMSANGYTPVWYAIDHCTQVLPTLLAAGVDPTIKSPKNEVLLIYFIHHIPALVNMTIQNPRTNVDQLNHHNVTPLIMAIRLDKNDIVQSLLERGANPNLQGGTNMEHPLMFAVERNSVPIVTMLMEHGANPNHADNMNQLTPLSFAFLHKRIPIMTILLSPEWGERRADPNWVDNEGRTILDHAIEEQEEQYVRLLIENGAHGTANIQQLVNEGEIQNPVILEMLRERLNIIPQVQEVQRNNEPHDWAGWSQADISHFNTVFLDNVEANNNAVCPVCLKYTLRESGCMYMRHNCRTGAGFYHKELYNKYKDSSKGINFCTICGRICNFSHDHYHLSAPQGPVPVYYEHAGNYYDDDCRVNNFGGGIPEKLARFLAMRDKALELNAHVGQMSKQRALEQIVEAAWAAPMNPEIMARAERQLAARAFNRPNTNFPTPEQRNAAAAAAMARAAPAAAAAAVREQTWQPALLHRIGENVLYGNNQNENSYRNNPNGPQERLIQFRHQTQDGEWNNHENEWISRDSLRQFIQRQVGTFETEEAAGYCFLYPDCDARLYPEEVRPFISQELYEQYRAKFDEKFGNARGGTRSSYRRNKIQKRTYGGNEYLPFYTEISDGACLLPKKPKSIKNKKNRIGGLRRTKKQHQRRK